jgi:hypothetical protein
MVSAPDFREIEKESRFQVLSMDSQAAMLDLWSAI